MDELKSGGSSCKVQKDDLVLCDDKTIRNMYHLARIKEFENSAWNREGRKCKTRQMQRSLDPTIPDERRLGGRAGVGYGEATQRSVGKMIEMFQ